MLKFTITPQEKISLELRHKKARDVRECERIKAVLLASECWYTSSIAQGLRKSELIISRHLGAYLKKRKLKPENGGSGIHLNNEQTYQFIENISEKTYAYIHQTVVYISGSLNVKYTLSGLNKWLHQQGFTYKKSMGVIHKFNSEKQAEFVEYYKALNALLPKDEMLFFMDAMHQTQATKITSGWIGKGVAKVVKPHCPEHRWCN